MGLDKGQGSGEVLLDSSELHGELVARPRDFVKLHLDTRGREFAVCSEIDEVLFLHGQLAELRFELLAKELLSPSFVGDGLFEARPDCGDELLAEADRLVVDFDGALDALHVGVGRIADVILHAAAEEVRVLAAIATGGAHDDHALDDPILQTATAAPDGALEVVVVLDATFSRLVSRVEERLDLLEQLGINQGLVAPVVGLAFVLDLSEVVAVAEHPLHLRYGNRRSWASGRRPRSQSAIRQLGRDVVQRVLACGVQLKGELHERGTLGVDGDGTDLATVDALERVQVADGCAAERTAALGLLPHLVGDVSAVCRRAVLVEGCQDAVHQLTFRGVVNLFGRGDERDAALLEVGHDDGVVEPVSGEPAELVDDDVVDVALAADAFEHLLKGHALGHLGAGSARFDVLADDCQPELFGLAGTGHALGRDGDPLGVVVGVQLPLAGDAEVDHGPTARWCVGRRECVLGGDVLIVCDGRCNDSQGRWRYGECCGRLVSFCAHGGSSSG